MTSWHSALAIFLVACGGAAPLPPPPLGTPLALTDNQWTWVDFPDAVCDDGSATGIGVYRSTASPNLLVFMNGGGACWDYATCYQLNTSTHGPYSRANFDADVASGAVAGTLLDHTDPTNPFRDYSFVFIPYCTGDLHGGANTIVYSDRAIMRTTHHVGHTNVLAYLKRLGATFTAPGRVVVSGSSAGGYGALLNYPTFRWYWPKAKMDLVDDSGPPLPGDYYPTSYLPAWQMSWRLDLILDPLCGMSCRTDFSIGASALAHAYPNDRLALLSSLQDRTIRGYLLLGGPSFEQGLRQLAVSRLDPSANFRYFFVAGDTHTMLGSPAAFTSNGTPLDTWLARQVSDDPAWASTTP